MRKSSAWELRAGEAGQRLALFQKTNGDVSDVVEKR